MSADAPQAPKRKARFVQVSDEDEPETRHKLSPAKGLLIGAAICGGFWAAVAALVAASR